MRFFSFFGVAPQKKKVNTTKKKVTQISIGLVFWDRGDKIHTKSLENHLLFAGNVAHDGDDHAILARQDRRRNLTISLFTAAIIPALIFPDLGIVLAVTGK